MDQFLKSNLEMWNELVDVNSKSHLYDLEGFINNPNSLSSTLKRLELNELGDVKGKKLLHLQCHFGMDTLSFGRLGALVTGVDFSDKAIALARKISERINIKATFICCNLYDLDANLDEKFDIVFTSYGVLTWLPDLKRWGEIVAQYLKPGGNFYIIEFHPFANLFDNELSTTDLRIAYSYFNKLPLKFEEEAAYADRSYSAKHASYEWTYTISEVVNSLINAGLEIEFLHEFPFCNYDKFPFMKQNEDGWWVLNKESVDLPLLFSLRAKKKLKIEEEHIREKK